ncbi:YbfB/YjiJ family MFS transporter [Streptomyces sp. NBC_01320]|uniref:YbfB/YjiJ family MFS transporter n=1 Tax=Streptomyces sp. NBC_01320 TaxID=2903824 RepID=UPI002E0E452E|nr:YbfB/YjiJ family MFS transporter [Streptomyces sp. NBC_01320]
MVGVVLGDELESVPLEIPSTSTSARCVASAIALSSSTANFIGYLAGALVSIATPAVVRSAAALRCSLVVLVLVLVLTLALMPVTHDGAAWFGLRLTAGAASALV